MMNGFAAGGHFAGCRDYPGVYGPVCCDELPSGCLDACALVADGYSAGPCFAADVRDPSGDYASPVDAWSETSGMYSTSCGGSTWGLASSGACTPWFSGAARVDSCSSCDFSVPTVWGVQACWPQPPQLFGQASGAEATSEPYHDDGDEVSCADGAPSEPCDPQQLSLRALLFWQAVLEQPDPLEVARAKAGSGGNPKLLRELHTATANVTTLRPSQDGDSGVGSARRLDIALQFALADLHLVGVQETRCQWSVPRLS